MKKHAPGRWRAAVGATMLAGLAVALATTTPAAADPIGAGQASAFGGTISLGGEEVVPPTPLAEATLPGDAQETVIDIPADPLAVSGTLNAFAQVHVQSDIDSALEVVSHDVAGPYNARGEGLIEGAEVLLDAVAEDVSLVSADVIRAEAVAVCAGDAVTYSANSEIINLDIGGEDVPLNDPITQILDGLNDALEQSGLNAVVDIQRNVVTELDDGIAVDALVVTVLAAAGDDPVGEVRLGHAEVSGVTCGDLPECSDGVDNDGDGRIDFEAPEGETPDPQCDGPDDDTEASQCTDDVDNDGDGLVDEADPGCPGDEAQRADDDDETDPLAGAPSQTPAATEQLPRTGSNDAATVGIAGLLGAGALGALALRRRLG